MKGLLYKELIAAKVDIIAKGVIQFLVSVLIIAMAIIGVQGTDKIFITVACYFLLFMCSGMLDESFFRQDEKRPWCNFVTALPQTAKGQVACKYYLILIENLIMLCCCFLTDLLVVAIVGDATVSAIVVASILFCLQLIMSAMEIPVMIRFGSKSGISVKGTVITGCVVIVGIYLLFGDISFLMEGNIKETMMRFIESPKVIWIIALIPYLALGAYYFSYRISLKLYQKGAENYEQ